MHAARLGTGLLRRLPVTSTVAVATVATVAAAATAGTADATSVDTRGHNSAFRETFIETHRAVRILEQGGYSRTQSEALVMGSDELVKEVLSKLEQRLLTSVELDISNLIYNYEVKRLRTHMKEFELNEYEALKKELVLHARELDSFQQQFRNDLMMRRTSLLIEMNNQRTTIREDSRKMDERILDSSHRLQVALTDVRTSLERTKFQIASVSLVALLAVLSAGAVVLLLMGREEKQRIQQEKDRQDRQDRLELMRHQLLSQHAQLAAPVFDPHHHHHPQPSPAQPQSAASPAPSALPPSPSPPQGFNGSEFSSSTSDPYAFSPAGKSNGNSNSSGTSWWWSS